MCKGTFCPVFVCKEGVYRSLICSEVLVTVSCLLPVTYTLCPQANIVHHEDTLYYFALLPQFLMKIYRKMVKEK